MAPARVTYYTIKPAPKRVYPAGIAFLFGLPGHRAWFVKGAEPNRDLSIQGAALLGRTSATLRPQGEATGIIPSKVKVNPPSSLSAVAATCSGNSVPAAIVTVAVF